MKTSFLFLAFFALFAVSALALGTPSDFFSGADEAALRARLTEQLERRQSSDELIEEDYYAVATLASLSKTTSFPNSAQLCGKASTLLASASAKIVDAQAIHRALGVISALKCESQPSPATLSSLGTKLVESVLANDEAQLADLHAALAALQQIQKTASPAVTISSDVASEVAERIADLMEPEGLFRAGSSDEEGTAGNAGLAYHALALLKRAAALNVAPKKGADGKSEPLDASKQAALKHIKTVAESISQLLADADEEDDNIIEFEDSQNPLRATALFWIGAEALTRSGESVTVTESQVAKLAEFFLRHKRVSNAVDAYHLLRALKTVASNVWKKSPLVVTLPNSSVLASSKGEDSLVKFRVTDVFGKFASKANVYITKVYPTANEKQVILHNQQATPVSTNADETLYSFNILAAKPDQGLYSIDLSVAPESKDAPVFGAVGVVRGVKVVVTAELSDVAVQVVDALEDEDLEHAYKVAYPEKVAEVIKANPLQHVLVSFRVRSQGRPLPVQQAFVVFRHEESGHEVILPAQLTGNKYKVHLNLREAGRAFQGRSGKYSVHLLVGDAFLHRPYFWPVADVFLSLGKQREEPAAPSTEGLKPEVHHQFRKPEKRPPPTVSMTFTALVVGVPVLVLFVGLFLVGANFSNFPLSGTGFLSAVGFLGCISAVIGLYVLYWLQLTMVETLVYLAGLGLVTVLVGWQALRHRHYARLAASAKDTKRD